VAVSVTRNKVTYRYERGIETMRQFNLQRPPPLHTPAAPKPIGSAKRGPRLHGCVGVRIPIPQTISGTTPLCKPLWQLLRLLCPAILHAALHASCRVVGKIAEAATVLSVSGRKCAVRMQTSPAKQARPPPPPPRGPTQPLAHCDVKVPGPGWMSPPPRRPAGL